MDRTLLRALTLFCALPATFAVAQTNKPVAWIYVSGSNGGSRNDVYGFSASADGKLTKISGSPWADNLSYLATNGSYLLGTTFIPTDQGKNIFSYQVESNGALKYIGANNIQDAGSDNACNEAGPLMLDHTGSYLYVYAWQAYCNSKQAIQSFAVNWKTGRISYLGLSGPTGIDNNLGYPLTMASNNVYVYASGDHAMDGELCGFKKAATGAIDYLPSGCSDTPWPQGMPSGWTASAGIVSADPTNHLAMNVKYYDPNGVRIDKIETIAIDATTGNLTTNSTFSNMPETAVDTVTAMQMAPGGKLLAVGGNNGIQIFNFNPSGQATPSTDLIRTGPLPGTYTGADMYWDSSNHLYVITADNALHVFTVTAEGAIEAPGSPYAIPSPMAITGHSL